MLRKLWFGAIAAGICLAGSVAHAAIQTGSHIQLDRASVLVTTDGNSHNTVVAGGMSKTYGGRGGGGEFLITELDVATPQKFKTFCVELNEHIAIGEDYWVTIDNVAKGGGVVGGPNDPLDAETQWLYYWYYTGALNSVVGSFVYDAAYSANELQEAIWHLEEGQGPIIGLAATLVATAASHVVANGSLPTNLGQVRVMNLWQSYNPATQTGTGYRQSQLFYEPPPQFGSPVPEPVSVAVWGVLAGVGSVVAWRRRGLTRAV